MIHVKDGQTFKSPLRATSIPVFRHVVFLLLTHFCGGQTQVDPPQPVVVMVGDDTVLPCQLEPAMDAFKMTMEWGRLDLDPRFIYVWHDGKALLDDQNTAYEGRTSLAIDKLKHGDISLKLSKVKVSDHGTYRCYIPKQSKQYFVELLVAAISSPGISLARLHKDSGRVVLQCESKGWYPEPELLWLDGEGKLLSAGPTETVRGPDDLYTLSSRVTVEKRHSNSFTCRVQQKIINQTRETQIHVPDDFFVAPCSSAAHITISSVACFVTVLAVFFSVWKWRRNKNKTETNMILQREKQQLMAESEKIKDTDMKMNEIAGELQRNKDILMKQKKEFMEQKEKLKQRKKKMEELLVKNEALLQSLEKEKTEDKTVISKAEYLQLKEIIFEAKSDKTEERKEVEKLVLVLEKLLETTDKLVRTLEKKEVENMEGK